MQPILKHIQQNILKGLLAITPILLCTIALLLLNYFIDKRIITFLNQYFDTNFFPGLGILILLCVLLFIGFIFTNVIGRRILTMIDQIIMSIPFIREIYILMRQVSDVLGKDDANVYKKTVLVNYPNANQWSIGFLAGKITDNSNGQPIYKVYIPMAHPLIGFVYFAEEKSMIDPGWTVHDGFKMVLTLGLVAPGLHKKF